MAEIVLLRLVQFGIPSFVALSIGAGFTRTDAWYAALRRPGWTPPRRVVGAVGWVLFGLLTLAMAIAWEAGPQNLLAWVILAAWVANLVLNAAWPYLFFAQHNVRGALWGLGALWVSILILTVLVGMRSPAAAVLLVPYLGWVAFSGYLNFEILRINPAPRRGAAAT